MLEYFKSLLLTQGRSIALENAVAGVRLECARAIDDRLGFQVSKSLTNTPHSVAR